MQCLLVIILLSFTGLPIYAKQNEPELRFKVVENNQIIRLKPGEHSLSPYKKMIRDTRMHLLRQGKTPAEVDFLMRPKIHYSEGHLPVAKGEVSLFKKAMRPLSKILGISGIIGLGTYRLLTHNPNEQSDLTTTKANERLDSPVQGFKVVHSSSQ